PIPRPERGRRASGREIGGRGARSRGQNGSRSDCTAAAATWDHSRRMRRSVTALACLGAGIAMAAALPPWGWWPLAFVGVAGLDRLIAGRPRWSRFRRGMLVGIGLYIPSLAWMYEMTGFGFFIAALAYAALLGLAMVIVPARAPGRWLALPGAIALAEL